MDFSSWISTWRGVLERGADLIPGPQLIEGLAETIIAGGPINPPTGRAACVKSGNWHERWVLTNPANARNANSAIVQAIPPLDPDPTIDWMTSPLLYQGLAAPVRDAKDAFVYVTPVPTIPPLPPPPPCDETRKYKVSNVAVGGATVQRGALYRQIFHAGGQDTWWYDHWVLWTGYQAPTIGGVKLRLDRDDPPGTLAAFLSAAPANAKYALVELKWKVP